MKELRKVSKKYFLRQIMACWMILSMAIVMPVQIAMAVETPGADVLPSGIINSTGINAPVIDGLNMDITQTAGEAIINWNNFDIGADAGVKFIQPGSSAAVMNRVHDGNVTGIMGSLTANGRVFIINPAGMVFGEGAVVNVSQLVASSLDITDDDFMNGIYTFAGEGGMVSNYGQISAEQVALIGRKVLNAGVIEAPAGTVVMASGGKVFLGAEGSDVVVEVTGVTLPDAADAAIKDGDVINEGTIEASGGTIVLAAGDTWSRAVEGIDGPTVAVDGGVGRVGQFGTLNADGVEGDGGSITLTAADIVVLGSDSVTTANAGDNGDGGDVVVYSPDTALFRDGALVEAKGGGESGDGGFFELSGKEDVEIEGQVDLAASSGENGQFLIDPRNVKIVAGSSDQGDWDGSEWDPKWRLGYAKLGIETLEGYLAGQDVTITTDGFTLLQAGWVWFDAGRDVQDGTGGGSNNSLTVNAHDSIRLDSGINFTGSGDVTLNAQKHINVNAPVSTGGDLKLYADTSGNVVGDMHSSEGATLDAGGDIDIKGNDIILGDAVDAGGDLTITGRDCHPGDDEYEWGNVWAKSTLDAGGNIEISVTGEAEESVKVRYKHYYGHQGRWYWDYRWESSTEYYPGTITLDGDVTAGANLSLFNDTYTTNVTGRGVTLQAGQDVFLVNDNAGPTEKDNATKLEGKSHLAIIAGAGPGVTNGEIHADDTTISVAGSTLVMHQDESLDTADYMFGNQGATDLTLISDKGSVTSTRTADGGLNANAADKWKTIGATAKQNINLSGDGSIILGDSGTNPNLSLRARKGDVNVRAGYNVAAQKHIVAGDDIRIRAKHGVQLQGARAGEDMTVKADVDRYWGENITANNRLEAGRDMTLEGGNVILKNGGEAGRDMDIMAHGLYSLGGGAPGTLVGGGDVVVDGALTAGGSMDITAINYQDAAPPANGPGLWGGSTPYNADGSIYLNDGATAGDMTLLADTYIEAGEKLTTTSGNLVAHAGTNGGTDFQLTNRPPAPGTNQSQYDVVLKDGAESSTNMVVTAADDIKSDGKLTSGNNMRLKAGDDIHLNKAGVSAESGANMKIFADRDNGNTPPIGDVDVEGDLLAENDIDIKASNDTIYLAGDVKTHDGNITFHNKVVADGAGNQVFNANADGGKVLHARKSITKTTSGNLKLMGGRIGNDGADDANIELDLDGNVIVEHGSLLLGLDGKDDDVSVAAGKKLQASKNVTVFDTLNGEGDLTVKAGNDITLHKDVTSAGDMLLKADNDGSGSGDMIAMGNLESTGGSIDIYAANDTIHLENDYVKADDDVTLHNNTIADDGVLIKAGDNVRTEGTLAGKGDLTVEAGDDIQFGDDAGDVVVVEKSLVAKSGLDSSILYYLFPSGSKGSIQVNANVEAGDMLLSAGAGLPGYSDSHVTVADGATLTANRKTEGWGWHKRVISEGNITIEAHHDVTLGGAVDADGDLVINADRHDNWPYSTPDHMLGGDVLAKGTLDAGGAMDISGNNITLEQDATSKRDMTITGDTSADWAGGPAGEVYAKGNLESKNGSIDIYAANDTIHLENDYVKADDDVTLHANTIADDGVLIKAGDNVSTEGTLTGKGDLTVEAGDDIQFGDDAGDNVLVDGTLAAKSGLDNSLFFPSRSKGSIEAAGDVTAGDMQLSAGAGLPGYSNSHVSVAGNLTTTDGDMIVEAHHDITLSGDVDSAGNLVLNADRHDNWPHWTPDHMMGGDVEVAGAVDAVGAIDMYGNNITLDKDVTSGGDMTLTGNTSEDFAGGPVGDVTAMGNLTSTGGSIEITSDDTTTYIGGNVTAEIDVLLNNNTKYIGEGTQNVTAGQTLTAHGYQRKVTAGHLELYGGSEELAVDLTYAGTPGDPTASTCEGNLDIHGVGDVQISGDLTTFGECEGEDCDEVYEFVQFIDEIEFEPEPLQRGGVSVISDQGKIFTRDGINDDTLNVNITGNSDHMLGLGVDLPKDYDQPAPVAAGEYETGKAAIVIMSEKALKLGPDGTLTAEGTYYTGDKDDDGKALVDDRPGVDFANYDREGKPGGDPIDIAIYLAGNSREVLDDTGVPISSDYEGDVHVDSPVTDLPDGAVMVIDAYDTVTFGDAFENSLKDGNVGWLEVCSRISGAYEEAWDYNKLPKQDGAWDIDNYVWRGEGGGDDGGAWVLKPNLPADPRVVLVAPNVEGCPELVQAAAVELGITAETVQIGIGNAIALSPSIQACQACAKLVNAAAVLKDADGSRMAALVQLFNTEAPAGAPFTPAMGASIATAFESAAEGSQYASAMEYVDAFAQYVAVLDIELGSPVGDSVAFVMEKHGAGVMGSDNANIAAYVATRMEAIGQP
ncbi:MAG: filamentous hemagglutinin N-terminal domain-containing protein [Planctomycetes bacterium]|nr:filamentous hemagglutinin N-terminal domain-containing protein [Planctomycetota bacterium]